MITPNNTHTHTTMDFNVLKIERNQSNMVTPFTPDFFINAFIVCTKINWLKLFQNGTNYTYCLKKKDNSLTNCVYP